MTAALFAIDEIHPSTSIGDDLTAFSFNGDQTIVEMRDGIPYYFNEFWTARQRQGHSIHEVSYRACFKPQLPEFFISRLTVDGDGVYDPFMGRGTTPIQAALMGRRPLGNDVNPISTYLTRPRTNPPTIAAVAARLDEIDWSPTDAVWDELLVFYHPDTLAEITALRSYLIKRETAGHIDAVDDWIRMVAVNRLTGHSSGFFSVYSLPPNQAVTIEAQRKINEKRNQTPPRRSVPAIILKKTRSLLKDGTMPPHPMGVWSTAKADETREIESGAASLVVTSPPFLDVVQYAADNWLRCWFVGVDAKAVPIAMYRKVEDWTKFIQSTFSELERIVRPGGHVAFEVGEVRNGTVELDRLVLEAIRPLRFKAIGVVVNVQEFTKTANCWGVSNNTKGTNTNRIVLAERL